MSTTVELQASTHKDAMGSLTEVGGRQLRDLMSARSAHLRMQMSLLSGDFCYKISTEGQDPDAAAPLGTEQDMGQ